MAAARAVCVRQAPMQATLGRRAVKCVWLAVILQPVPAAARCVPAGRTPPLFKQAVPRSVRAVWLTRSRQRARPLAVPALQGPIPTVECLPVSFVLQILTPLQVGAIEFS